MTINTFLYSEWVLTHLYTAADVLKYILFTNSTNYIYMHFPRKKFDYETGGLYYFFFDAATTTTCEHPPRLIVCFSI